MTVPMPESVVENDTAAEATQGQETQQINETGTGQQQNGINPAWNELLGIMPTQLHPQLIPYLQKWDQGVQSLVQKVHSQYEPYKQFVDAQVDPQNIQYALQIMEHLNNNPRQIWDAMGQHYGWIGEQGQPEPQAAQQQNFTENYDDLGIGTEEDPRIAQMAEQLELMRQAIVADWEQKQQQAQQQQLIEQQQQEDQALEQELTSLREKYGDYDEQYVLGLMGAGMEAEKAVQQYQQLTQQILQNRPGNFAPTVLSGKGGIPSTAVDRRNMTGEQRRALVANMLAAAKQQGQFLIYQLRFLEGQ